MKAGIERLARGTAVLGGLVLTLVVILACLSIFGRGLNTLGHSGFLPGGLGDALIASGVGPINGDFELVEAGVAFAIFAFLPICQLSGAHAVVDVFTSALPQAVQRWIAAFWECALSAAILLITWRLGVGMEGKIANGETTFMLQFPIWWSYAASFAAALVASIVALWCAYARLREAATGRVLMTDSGGL
ncbi:Tripartite ATP-independent transporter, DctQ component [Roseivivax halotolerans]|uniref:TRAP transporter small permease protein n=1 Tax=Roseivivax halotolerans TaxID=93684 RepID=A0A1I5ZJ47_9RHOB|nr:TRAP transporter small permease [Roseivivax halotolerans]SFQ56430.1 Tripartite ATP-independent transporter, DctQ component [Roseivivax halotolerans]